MLNQLSCPGAPGHVFMCLFATYISFLENYANILSISFFVFILLYYKKSLCRLDTSILSDTRFVVLSTQMGLTFPFLTFNGDFQRVKLSFNEVRFIKFFFLNLMLFASYIKK